MIFKQTVNTNPMNLCAMAIKYQAQSVIVPATPYDPSFCYCSYICKENVKLFGGSSLSWQNDRTSYAFVKTISTDTGVISLWKNGVKLTDITDNSLGVYIASYTDKPKQYSFVADWDLIYTAHGVGEYEIRNNYTVLGVANEYLSGKYDLELFSDESAHGYVKLEWMQEGEIENNVFSFCTPLYHSIKIKGDVTIGTPETIKDSYQNSNRDSKMFRTEQKNNYIVKTKLIDKKLLSLLNENTFLSEKITVTDFNLFGTKFIQKDLSFEEVSNLEDFLATSKMDLEILFKDYKQNIIKNNC